MILLRRPSFGCTLSAAGRFGSQPPTAEQNTNLAKGAKLMPQVNKTDDEWRRVFEVWIERGVKIFRVDNPHTKPIPFWAWLIREIQAQHPEVIFLAEAFTKPKMMRQLAKIGFTQSYTYFTWRNTKHELTEYMQELTTTEMADYFRPNFFANTPDILHEYLQLGGRPAFEARLASATPLERYAAFLCHDSARLASSAASSMNALYQGSIQRIATTGNAVTRNATTSPMFDGLNRCRPVGRMRCLESRETAPASTKARPPRGSSTASPTRRCACSHRSR